MTVVMETSTDKLMQDPESRKLIKDLMLETHKVFAAKCDEIGPGLARNLEMAWDGIGEWRG